MIEQDIDLAIIGGGPAGLAAAISAKHQGVEKLLIIERNAVLGGILGQCIHDGFGVEMFKKSLTGPEYMERYIQEVHELGIPYMLDSMVTDLNANKELMVVNRTGVHKLHTKAIILAMGCRERTRDSINIAGTRPAGIFTAGMAQYFINMKNYLVGKKVVILGSGDIGLIMARRLMLEGAKVLAVVEKLPYPSGLPRNIVQCLEDYNIPLMLSHTVIEIKGNKRVEGITIARVDHNYSPILGTEVDIECDTLILSVGLIPENELSQKAGIELDPISGGPIVNDRLQTTVDGIFAAGNVLHVHDIVDWVSKEAEQAGEYAAKYVMDNGFEKSGPFKQNGAIKVSSGSGIRYVLPHWIQSNNGITLYLRVEEPAENVYLEFFLDGESVKRVKQRKVHPAMMIKQKLDRKELPNGKELRLEIQEK